MSEREEDAERRAWTHVLRSILASIFTRDAQQVQEDVVDGLASQKSTTEHCEALQLTVVRSTRHITDT